MNEITIIPGEGYKIINNYVKVKCDDDFVLDIQDKFCDKFKIKKCQTVFSNNGRIALNGHLVVIKDGDDLDVFIPALLNKNQYECILELVKSKSDVNSFDIYNFALDSDDFSLFQGKVIDGESGFDFLSKVANKKGITEFPSIEERKIIQFPKIR